MASQPNGEPLGYDTAISLGVTALEQGYSAAAISYLEHAAKLRPGRYVLVQLAKAQRDQGRTEEARATLAAARERPDGEDGYVLVSLAAILCDLGEHGAAFEVALAAKQLRPEDPATLAVLARTMRELTGSLSKHEHIDPAAIAAGREAAAAVAAKARAVRPADQTDITEARRRRAQASFSPPAPQSEEPWVPLDQSPGRPLSPESAVEARTPAVGPVDPQVEGRDRWWRRALKALGLRLD